MPSAIFMYRRLAPPKDVRPPAVNQPTATCIINAQIRDARTSSRAIRAEGDMPSAIFMYRRLESPKDTRPPEVNQPTATCIMNRHYPFV